MKTAVINADLHSHSNISDGLLPPAGVAALAHQNGVTLWALTDHDDIASQPAALAAARGHGMGYLSGVEISVSYLHETVHILGLGFALQDHALIHALGTLRSGRIERAQQMARSLKAEAGIDGAWEGALRHAANPGLITRLHFARYLVQIGVAHHTHAVFERFLTRGKPGYVEQQWAALDAAVGWIRAAGGMAVIAHPARYHFDPEQQQAFFDDFSKAGGEGIEVVTTAHNAREQTFYAAQAQQRGWLASRGSDFHGDGDSALPPGCLPPLPDMLIPVWQKLAGRVL